MGEELFCKPTTGLRSFTKIGLPVEYDEIFPPKGIKIRRYIRELRRSCYQLDYEPVYNYEDAQHIRAEVEILEALCKYRYIRAEFRPIYVRLHDAMYPKPLKHFENHFYAWAFSDFIDDNYESFSPGAYLRENMIESGFRQLFPGLQYDLMVALQWPTDLESAKQELEGAYNGNLLFEIAILEKAFENMNNLTMAHFREILEKAIVF